MKQRRRWSWEIVRSPREIRTKDVKGSARLSAADDVKEVMVLDPAHRVAAVFFHFFEVFKLELAEQLHCLIACEVAGAADVPPFITISKDLPGKSTARPNGLEDPVPQ